MSQRLKSILLFLLDGIILFMSLNLTLFIFKKGVYVPEFWQYHIEAFIILFPVWFIVFYIEGLYSLKTFKNSGLAVSLIRSLALNLLISLIYFYLFMDEVAPKKNLIILISFALVGMFLVRKLFLSFLAIDTFVTKVHLIGTQEDHAVLTQELNERKHLGYKIISTSTNAENLNITGIDLIVIDRNNLKNKDDLKKIFELLNSSTDIMDLALFSERTTGKIPVTAIEETWFIQYCGLKTNQFYEMSKAILDRGTALLMIILIGPFYLFLLVFLIIFHGRPLFFTQKRTGYLNKTFTLYKLRSMVVNAEASGAQWSKPGDARITKIGKFLRKTRLDELPQLWNIFNGDMSLVGPRPERPEIINSTLAVKIPFYNQRHLVKPGVTGWAQVSFRYGYSEDDSLQKLQYDLYYIKNKSIWLDISIILKTIKTVLTGAGQ
jgi:exopolysaccharide biosynthesis polyprenyl glycosylphosphotransferase